MFLLDGGSATEPELLGASIYLIAGTAVISVIAQRGIDSPPKKHSKKGSQAPRARKHDTNK